MWLRDLFVDREVLLIGRDRVELWQPMTGGLELHRQQSLAEPGLVSSLEAAVGALFVGDTDSLMAARARIDVVIESAWMPLMLLPAGASTWSERQLEALLRHRLIDLQGDRGEQVSDWALRVDYRPGDTFGLGYALTPEIRAAVDRALMSSGRAMASLQPALAWARMHRTQRQAVRATGWWLWLEQDRTLLVRFDKGCIVALHPAAAPVEDELLGQMLVRIEVARTGVDEVAPVYAGGWRRPGGIEAGVLWAGVSGISTMGDVADAAPATGLVA